MSSAGSRRAILPPPSGPSLARIRSDCAVIETASSTSHRNTRTTHPSRSCCSCTAPGAPARARRNASSTYADELGIAFVAPDSTAVSWDRNDRLASDVEFIDRALAVAFRRINTTPDRLRIGGFSDGASYSLSVGLTNGDLFARILALSPGFCGPALPRGKPQLYFTHGTRDEILPIDITSRKIVPMLQRAGYSVEYHEFDGKHETPPEITRPAFQWLIGS